MEKEFTINSVLTKAIESISENSGFYFKLLLVFTAATFFLTFIVPENEELDLASVVSVILIVIINAKLAVMVHRSVILDEHDFSRLFQWGRAETEFFKLILLLTFTMVVFVGLSYLIIDSLNIDGSPSVGPAIAIVFLIIGVYLGIVFSRISIVFPAAATGNKISLKQAWNASLGSTGTLFFLLIIVPNLTNKLLSKVPETNLALILLGVVLSILFVIFEVSILSHCYDGLITDKESNEQFTQKM